MLIINSLYISGPLSIYAPKGSITPVDMFISLANVSIILGLYWGSEKIHFIFSSWIRSWTAEICLAPGRTSGFKVRAPAGVRPNLFSKYWYASWKTT